MLFVFYQRYHDPALIHDVFFGGFSPFLHQQQTQVSHHFHQLSLLWHFVPNLWQNAATPLLYQCTKLLIISFSAWICSNWINPVLRCGIHLTPLSFLKDTFFSPFSPSFQQQIVKSVDSFDRRAKKAEFIIQVIAWSVKVIHSFYQTQRPHPQSDMLTVNVLRHTVKKRGV